ncbi:MAG TPA: T9SS type A sorting domain-containing protein, partial [Bacteroidia bacterium]|nr:T9SS type A sorting domain-containing protein [Bacteroidia bacterium]
KLTLLLSFLIFNLSLSNAQTITTMIGNGIKGSNGNGGQATSAQIETPVRVIIDKSGNFYVTEPDYNDIRKINKSGVISLFKNGFNYPTDLSIDDSGNIYLMDAGNYEVKKINTSGTITVIAGNGTAGNSGNGGKATAANIDCGGISVDDSGNIYIAQSQQNNIRKINRKGIISTIAGNGINGFSGDGGPATNAEFSTPVDATVDSKGNIYIADEGNSRIRKIDKSGIITTIAGNGIAGYSGDGGPADSAELSSPNAPALDANGNIYFSDLMNNCIRVISSSTNIITTVTGNGTAGYIGDNGSATSAELTTPASVTIDSIGDMYIADYGNSVVRMVKKGLLNSINQFASNSVCNIFPNPSNGNFTITMDRIISKSQIEVYNILSEKVYTEALRQDQGDNKIDLSGQLPGIYLYRITSDKGEYIASGKLIID